MHAYVTGTTASSMEKNLVVPSILGNPNLPHGGDMGPVHASYRTSKLLEDCSSFRHDSGELGFTFEVLNIQAADQNIFNLHNILLSVFRIAGFLHFLIWLCGPFLSF
jgi:hypothetical protein